MSILQKLFRKKEEVNFKNLLQQDSVIVDVRSKKEFENDHIKDAVNIPLDLLPLNIAKLGNKNKIIITYCASGVRSGVANNFLKKNGYLNVYNGGSLQSLRKKI